MSILAACIRAEATQGDITTSTIARCINKPRDETQDRISELRDAGLLEITDARAYNEKSHRVTDAGYAQAGVKRPFWQELGV
jgi:Mn-dependent DtxR family transcriptional regulator